jgi:hypothetical protein
MAKVDKLLPRNKEEHSKPSWLDHSMTGFNLRKLRDIGARPPSVVSDGGSSSSSSSIHT